MLPLLQSGARSSAQHSLAMFYYKDEPQDLLKTPPHGIITLNASTSVEPFAASSKYSFCLRLSNAQQQLRRMTSKET